MVVSLSKNYVTSNGFFYVAHFNLFLDIDLYETDGMSLILCYVMLCYDALFFEQNIEKAFTKSFH